MARWMPPSLREVWEWKAKAEEKTRGMTREQLIEHYRQGADEFEKKMGISLRRISGGNAHQSKG